MLKPGKLLEIRQATGMTQPEFGETLLEVASITVSSYERGVRTPSLKILMKYKKLAKAFGVHCELDKSRAKIMENLEKLEKQLNKRRGVAWRKSPKRKTKTT